MIPSSFVRGVAGVRTSATTDDVELPSFGRDTLICFDRIAVGDVTSKATLVLVGFKTGAGEVYLQSFVPAAAGEIHAVAQKIYVPSNYRPFMRVTGGTAGDVLVLHAYGYIMTKGSALG